jgi:HD-GYP domain-containing protein (c-di-GMP phosphodiesterase class II)
MFDRVRLGADLVDCRGVVLAPAGFVLSPQSIEEAARSAVPPTRYPLPTAQRARLLAPLDQPAYRHLFAPPGVRDRVARALAAVALPGALHDELGAMEREAPALLWHGQVTAAVATRLLLTAAGEAPRLSELAVAALLHDLGMRHLPRRLSGDGEGLEPEDAALVAQHPLSGAWHLARVLGRHPAVAAAHAHHWRAGQGYPRLPTPPSRAVEVISVASAFAAMTQPRPFRSEPWEVRSACDLLVAEARGRTADEGTVRLLVHALRGGQGDPRAVRFGASRGGPEPAVNHHAPVAPPPASL